MADVRVTIDGDEELARLLRQTGHRVTEAVKNAVSEAALVCESTAKRATPVDTGRLRSSIGVERREDGLSADVGTNVEYAPHVEYGTVTQSAQPYMRPARERVRREFPDTVAKHARRVIDR